MIGPLSRLGRRGIVAAELAALAPLFILMLVGSYDAVTARQSALPVEPAAEAGAQRAISDPANMAAAKAAVAAALPGAVGATIDLPVLACGCAGVAIACGASCPGGLLRNVTVTARQALRPLFLIAFSQGNGSAVARLH